MTGLMAIRQTSRHVEGRGSVEADGRGSDNSGTMNGASDESLSRKTQAVQNSSAAGSTLKDIDSVFMYSSSLHFMDYLYQTLVLANLLLNTAGCWRTRRTCRQSPSHSPRTPADTGTLATDAGALIEHSGGRTAVHRRTLAYLLHNRRTPPDAGGGQLRVRVCTKIRTRGCTHGYVLILRL